MKLQHNPKNCQWSLTIPAALVQAKQWERGQKLHFVFNEKGQMVLLKEGETL
jgi:hypothetical protein